MPGLTRYLLFLSAFVLLLLSRATKAAVQNLWRGKQGANHFYL